MCVLLLPVAAIRGQMRSCGWAERNQGGEQKQAHSLTRVQQNNIPHVHGSHKTLSNAKQLVYKAEDSQWKQ